MDKRAIIAAYERAAKECGVSFDEARDALKRHWSGTAGRG